MVLKIGIIADSHGEAKRIENAVAFLNTEGCQSIYHLGDICDSYHLGETEACLDLIHRNGIQALKGNNDHVITRYHRTHEHLILSQAQRDYLNHLPLVLAHRNAIFAHSLPFEQALGLSCMIRPMDEFQADLFFRQFPGKSLFRGHGHDPQIISPVFPTLEPCPLSHAVPVDLRIHRVCIVTCGALTENLCLIWQPENQILTSHQF
ncbi:metallophosphoesterase family protein [bacterium]|nr:metallophosphoesterase family protein [bacterium]